MTNPLSPFFLASSVATFLLGIWVVSLDSRNRIYTSWFLFCLSVAFWSFGLGVLTIANSRQFANLFYFVHYFGAIAIPITFLYFVRVYFLKDFRIGWDVAIGICLILTQDVLFLAGRLAAPLTPKWRFSFYTNPGPFYWFFVVYFFFYVFYSFLLMFQSTIKDKSGERKAKQFFMVATGIGYATGCSAFLLVYDINFPPYGMYVFLLFPIITTYAIVRHRLLDIEVIVKKTIVFAGLFGMVMTVIGAVTTVLQQVIGTYLPVHSFVSMTLSAFAAILLYEPTQRWLLHVTEDVLFQQPIDYEQIDRRIAEQIQITDLAEQARNIVEIFRQGFVLDCAAILLLDEEKKVYRPACQAGDSAGAAAPVVSVSDPAIASLNKSHEDVLIKKNLSVSVENGIGRLMESWRAEAAAKICFKETLIALLLLGKKKSDREYTQKDTDFLERVSKSLGVAINNAKAFKFKEDYFVLMAEKNKTDVLARLSQGIDHEIKNPLNAIKPAAQRTQMMMEKLKAGRPEAFQSLENYLQMIIRNCDRMVAIMTRLRNFAQPIKEAGDFKLEPLSLKEAVEDALELVSKKQLEIDGIAVVNQIDPDMRIFGERASVVQVFWNLIMNAYHAVDRNGRIEVSGNVSKNDGKVIVAVADTGSGISPENIDKIFTPFFTTKPTNLSPESNERFTGTGLGLCYVKQYVEGLGGSIACASEVGKGTTFYLKFLRAENGQKANQNISG